MTYFDGSDTLAHRFWHLRQPVKTIAKRLRAHGLPAKAAKNLKARFGKVVEGYYKVLDEGLGRIIDAAGPNATIMIVSDHGIGTQKTRRSLHKHVPFDAKHTLDGVMMVSDQYPTVRNPGTRHCLRCCTNRPLFDGAPSPQSSRADSNRTGSTSVCDAASTNHGRAYAHRYTYGGSGPRELLRRR